MKTARITLLVEFEDKAPTGAFFNGPAFDGERAARMDIVPMPRCATLQSIPGAQIIGTPKVEIDKHHRCSMSKPQLNSAIRAMRERGGSFAQSLGHLLDMADNGNSEKLLDSFHDLVWGYVSADAEV